jgi:cytochrome P450
MKTERVLRRSRRRGSFPVVDLDLFSRDVLQDSTAAFEQIREAGPVVWLARHRIWAIGRYADVRSALRDDDLFRSGRGVGANAVTNILGHGTTICSDGETHTAKRRLLMESLGASQLASTKDRLDAEAVRVIDDLIGTDVFEGNADCASVLPVRVVADLVGIELETAQALRWAAQAFNAGGPLNRRGLAGQRSLIGLLVYALHLREAKVRRGSWASSLFRAQRRGELGRLEARKMIVDFVVPSLDTTILATTEMLWQLGCAPDIWQRIRADESLIPSAVVEAVRLASPVRLFTRVAARDTGLGGVTLPAGARVALLFGAANLDETQFPDPQRFDLDRPAGGHVAWGNGRHTCVGLHLAKLEMEALLRAMVPRVDQIQVWESTRLCNNMLQGIASFKARFKVAAPALV